MRIYLDSATVIYYVQRVTPWHSSILVKLTRPGVVRAISDLIRMECLVKPLERNDTALLTDFWNILQWL